MHEDGLSSELSWGVLFQKKLRTLVELSALAAYFNRKRRG
jgi:hypothetical protein